MVGVVMMMLLLVVVTFLTFQWVVWRQPAPHQGGLSDTSLTKSHTR